jgi:ribosomal protein S18 acetylase RimI-like enzyme
MLQVAEADLLRRGFHKVVLNVNQDNFDARRLYEREGYCVVAEEQGRWSYLDQYGRRREVNEPAWRMEKELR